MLTIGRASVGPAVASASLRARIRDAAARAFRGALLRYVRAEPHDDERAGAARRVFILLWAADGMGGTIRAALNLADYLVERDYEVEIISGIRDRDVPFFGPLPAGVHVRTLDDRRDGAEPHGVMRLARRALRRRGERANAFRGPCGCELQACGRTSGSCTLCTGAQAFSSALDRGSISWLHVCECQA